MKSKLKMNVKPASVQVLLGGLAVLILMSLAAKFNLINLTSYQSSFLIIISSLFLMTEVSAFAMMRGKKKRNNILDIIIGVIALLAIVIAGFDLVGASVPVISTYQSFINLALMIFVFVEIFRKN